MIILFLSFLSLGFQFKKKLDLKNADDAFLFYQRLIESMKFAYAQRGLLGDPDVNSEAFKKNITKVC